MKKIILTCIVSFCTVFQSIYGQSLSYDIISYKIVADYNLSEKSIDVKAFLEIEKTENLNNLKILLSPHASLKSVTINNSLAEVSRLSSKNDTLLLEILEQCKNSEKINIAFEYILPADSFSYDSIILIRRYDHWYPVQYDDNASMELDVKLPKNYSAFANGDVVVKIDSNKNTYKYVHNNFFYYTLMIVKSEIYDTITRSINNININFHFVSNDTVVNNKIINQICNSFSFYNKYIGTYRNKQLTVVEIPFKGAQLVQSLSTLVLMGSPFIEYFKMGYNWAPHEIAHQWWGAGMFVNSKTNCYRFLEESITEYFSLLYIENTLGEDSFRNQLASHLELYREIENKNEKPIIDIKTVSNQEDGYVIYQKGPLVVNKLRNLMGDDAWKFFILEIYNTYYGKFLTYDGFIEILSNYDSDGKIRNELNKWLSETGYTD